MQHAIGQGILAAWLPIVLALFRAIGPARALPLALFGGFLLLPRWPECGWPVLGLVVLDKRTLTGLAIALWVACFDRARLSRFRPGLVDLPLLGLVLVPLASAAVNGSGAIRGSIDQSFVHLMEWGVPYLAARVYYDDAEGPSRLARQIAWAGLACVPVIAFESTFGPSCYLANLAYGIHPMGVQTHARLGGWRPEAMLSNGLELAEWMALAATLSLWMWSIDGWRARMVPGWLSTPILGLAALACRGVYGYAVLAIGLATIPLVFLTRSRVPLLALALVPPIYVAARVGGLWDGQVLVTLAERAGNRDTTAIRIRAEDGVLGQVRGLGLILGQGGRWPDWSTDGQWPTTLKGSGLVGLALLYATMLVPAALIVSQSPARSTLATPETGLALVIILHAISILHNTSLIVAVPMACGLLAGLARSRPTQTGRGPTRGGSRVATAEGGHATYRLGEINATADVPRVDAGRLVVVLAMACLLYVLGHARVDGQEAARFVGGLGSALLFGAAGAAVAGLGPRPLARAASFGLAFAVLGISFNLALHASSRPTWSADILQGLALAAVVVAGWKGLTGGSPWAFAGLAALTATWWAFEGSARPFPGSQYLYASALDGSSLFPVLPWLSLAAIGASLVRASASACSASAIGFALAAMASWTGLRPFGPPVKFPLNPTYALLGASIVSAAFAASGPALRWRPGRVAASWLGRRWLLFFYVHLAIALGLSRAGLTSPVLCWPALAVLSMAATWAISWAADLVRPSFRGPIPWAVLALATVAVGVVPGLPPVAVLAVAWPVGLIFAALHDELATWILGPPTLDAAPVASGSSGVLAARVAVVVAVLVAPELARRLPPPIGLGPSSTVDAGSARDGFP